MRTLFGPDVVSGGSAAPLETHLLHPEHGVVTLPGRDILLQGIYGRHGADLVITSPEHGVFTVKGFFLSDQPPALSDGAGTTISGDQAALFAGPVAPAQFAAAAPAAAGASIGQVRSVTGTVQVIRADGTTVTLRVGDPPFQDDTIETGASGKVGVVLIDGTSLALGENG